MIDVLFWFLVVWIFGFIFHEYCHLWAAKLQGCNGKIVINFYKGIIPSLQYQLFGTPRNITMIDFAGGLGTAAILLPLSLIMNFVYTPLMIACFLVGLVNLTYGIYEGLLIRKLDYNTYMKWHYVLYAVTLIIGITLLL